MSASDIQFLRFYAQKCILKFYGPDLKYINGCLKYISVINC